MASIVFLLSILALLAAASAELCETRSIGDVHGKPVIVLDKIISFGYHSIHLNDVCSRFGSTYRIEGAEVTACTDELAPPSISFVSFTQVNIQSEGSARIVATVFCTNFLKGHQSHNPMVGSGVGRYAPYHAQVHGPAGRP